MGGSGVAVGVSVGVGTGLATKGKWQLAEVSEGGKAALENDTRASRAKNRYNRGSKLRHVGR
jgi:hypothetical protein